MRSPIFSRFLFASIFFFASTGLIFAQDGKGGKAVDPDKRSVDDCINSLRNGNPEEKLEALRILQRKGKEARPAIPDLIGALSSRQPSVREYAIVILGGIGTDAKEALPMLRQILRETKIDNSYLRNSLAAAIVGITGTVDLETTRVLVAGSTPKSGTPLVLGYLEPFAAELIPHLLVLLDDLDPVVRARSADAFLAMTKQQKGKDSILMKLGDKAKPIAPALEKHLNDKNPAPAIAVANALTHIDPERGVKAIPIVIHWLKEGSAKGFSAYTAAEVLRPVARQAIPQMIEALDEKQTPARWAIAATVAQLDGAIEPIIKALEHEKPFVRAGAAMAISANYHPASREAAALAVALKDSEYVVRFAAAEALVSTGDGRKRETVPVLVEAIRDGSEEEQRRAVQLLTRIGPAAMSALPSLLKLLEDKRFPVRFEAAIALTAIDSGAAVKGVPALIEGVQSDSGYNQHQAAKALAKIGPPAKEAVPALEKLFNAKYVHARYTSAEAVALIDSSKAEAAAKVIAATLLEKKKQGGMVRTYSLTSLRRIGPAARAAVPALNELLKDDDGPFLGEVALTAICLDPDGAKAARNFLREHLSKKNVDDEGYDFAELLPQSGAYARHFKAEIRMILENTTSPYFQEQACEAIAAIGPEAKDLEPLIKKVIAQSKRKSTVEAAQRALEAIGKK